MGAGKTTIGRRVAKRLNKMFYDLDWYIEARMHRTIPELFEERTEEGFRQIERNMLHEVAEFEDVVVSCGGGAPCFFDNMEYMNQQAETIYLKATPEVLFSHLQMGRTERPLLMGKSHDEMLAYIASQVEQREAFYAKARYTMSVNLLDNYAKVDDAVNMVLDLLGIKETKETL